MILFESYISEDEDWSDEFCDRERERSKERRFNIADKQSLNTEAI